MHVVVEALFITFVKGTSLDVSWGEDRCRWLDFDVFLLVEPLPVVFRMGVFVGASMQANLINAIVQLVVYNHTSARPIRSNRSADDFFTSEAQHVVS